MSTGAHHSAQDANPGVPTVPAVQNVLRDHVCATWVSGDGIQREFCDACLRPWPCDARVLAEEERTKLRVRADEAQAWADAYYRERARAGALEAALDDVVRMADHAARWCHGMAEMRALFPDLWQDLAILETALGALDAAREEAPDGKMHAAGCRMLDDWPHAPSGGPCSCAAASREGDGALALAIGRVEQWLGYRAVDGALQESLRLVIAAVAAPVAAPLPTWEDVAAKVEDEQEAAFEAFKPGKPGSSLRSWNGGARWGYELALRQAARPRGGARGGGGMRMQNVRACSVNGGVWDQRTYDAAIKAARESGRPLCKAVGLVGPCVTWPHEDGYCHWHQHPMYRKEAR